MDGRQGGETEAVRLTAWVRGRVQGVGFRWWVRARALELGLTGSATNLRDGRVEVVAEGPRPACQKLLDLLAANMTTDATSTGTAAGTTAGTTAATSNGSGNGTGDGTGEGTWGATSGRAVPADHPVRPGRVTGVTERWSAARGGVAGFLER